MYVWVSPASDTRGRMCVQFNIGDPWDQDWLEAEERERERENVCSTGDFLVGGLS